MSQDRNGKKRVFRFKKDTPSHGPSKKMGLKYHLLGDSSGYPAADYEFSSMHPNPLIIMERDEESSSLEH